MFDGVDENALAQLTAGAFQKTYARQELILWAGEGRDWTFLLLEGCARAYRVSSEGKIATLLELRRGDFLPTVSRRTYIDAAADETVVCRIPRKQYEYVRQAYSSVGDKIERALMERLLDAYDLIEELMCEDVRTRLSHVLARLARHGGSAISITREELGCMVGASRQQVTVGLSDLLAHGWIEYEPHQPREIRVSQNLLVAVEQNCLL